MMVGMYNSELKQNSWDVKWPMKALRILGQRWSLVSKQGMVFSSGVWGCFHAFRLQFPTDLKRSQEHQNEGRVPGTVSQDLDWVGGPNKFHWFIESVFYKPPHSHSGIHSQHAGFLGVYNSVHSITSTCLHIMKAFFHDTWGKVDSAHLVLSLRVRCIPAFPSYSPFTLKENDSSDNTHLLILWVRPTNFAHLARDRN